MNAPVPLIGHPIESPRSWEGRRVTCYAILVSGIIESRFYGETTKDAVGDVDRLKALSDDMDASERERVLDEIEARLENACDRRDHVRSLRIACTIPGNISDTVRSQFDVMIHEYQRGEMHGRVQAYEMLPDGFSFHESSPEIRRRLLLALKKLEVF